MSVDAHHSPNTRRSTIEDVASGAGVSVATVSRALRGLPNVAASTRLRVEAVATDLGYRADPAASRLAAGRSTTIAVVVPHLAGWFFATVVAGLEAVCDENGYELVVSAVPSPEDFARLAGDNGQLERRADGLVTVDINVPADVAESLQRRGIATVTIGAKTEQFPGVGTDNERVAGLAVDHLLSLGHQRIALVGGHQVSPLSFDVPRQREAGFRSAMQRAGAPIDERLLLPGNFGIDDGQEATSALFDLDESPTAIFAMSDEMAFGALMELRQRGLTPGRDVSVIGVDDHEFSRVVDLTTVSQRVPDYGARAARLVIDQLRRAADDRNAVHRPNSVSGADVLERPDDKPPARPARPLDSDSERHPGPATDGMVEIPSTLIVRSTTGPVRV